MALSRLGSIALAASFAALTASANASPVTIGQDYFMQVTGPYPSGEQLNGNGYYVGYTTVSIYADNGGTEGSLVATYNQAFCIDSFNVIYSNTPAYVVQAQGVGTAYDAALYPSTTSGLQSYLGYTYYSQDGSYTSNNDALNNKLSYDAVLGAKFNGNDANDSNIQLAIWDEGGASYSLTGINAGAATAAANAQSLVTNPNLYTSSDIAFLEVNGSGQSFMVSGAATVPTPSPTPEPGSLALLGTGMLGVAGAVRRRLKKA